MRLNGTNGDFALQGVVKFVGKNCLSSIL